MSNIANFPHGFLAPIGDNEVEHVSTIADPGKYRFAVEEGKVEKNLGATSFNTRRGDGSHDEHALVRGQLYRPDSGGSFETAGQGVLEFATRGEGKSYVEQRMVIRQDAIVSHVPIYAPNIGSTTSTIPAILRSPNGRLLLAAQDDGNLVLYLDGQPIRALFGVTPDKVW